MRNVKVAVALAALALAGCTSTTQSSTPPSGTTTAPPSATSSQPSTTLSSPTQQPPPPPQSSAAPLAGGPTEVPPQRVDGSTLSDLYKRQAWTSSDGRTLRVIGLAGGCKTASAEVTAQSADQVLITLVTTTHPDSGQACTQELHDVPLNVTLDAPLADRRVILESREQTA